MSKQRGDWGKNYIEVYSEMEARARQLQKIESNPEKFKVCVGCESVVSRNVAVCRICRSYRYEDQPELVIAQARELAKRPANTPKHWIE